MRPADDDRSPYPGLAAFTEEDAEFFFGREAEVAQVWRKLTTRRLLAVIGPSGVGKSSFLRAGLIPAAPVGWGVVVCQPGENPLAGLARGLLPEFEADRAAMEGLVGIRDADTAATLVTRWRERHDHALLVVDQFEELFTQNPLETQALFAGLLRKLVDNADVHVLLSMRDDFLCRCYGHEPLRPILDGLFALEQPRSDALRRALVEPAAGLGFSFEDGDLPHEMITEVEGERGALPLLAFAAARLWEKRDHESRLLTRQAYTDIGGVRGALARHAESTLTAVGNDRMRAVREIFRNLVTADGTRAVREWNELLSVFSDSRSESPKEVLRYLIDARLLTSYEAREGDEAPTRRVEIVHESLLEKWPRLVRWRTQDEDAARFRDQLRQAATLWHERGRTDYYLWTGKAYREYAVWLDNYPGGLSGTEGAFSDAMTGLATRRRRRRRAVMAIAIVVLVAVTGVFAALWQRSQREQRRAEAARLVTLGGLELDFQGRQRGYTGPALGLAFAIAALELHDSDEARLLAFEALAAGPLPLILDLGGPGNAEGVAFSPDGRWMAVGLADGKVELLSIDGLVRRSLDGHDARACFLRFSPDSEMLLVSSTGVTTVSVWSIPSGDLIRSWRPPHSQSGETSSSAAFFVEDSASVVVVSWDEAPRCKLWSFEIASGETVLLRDLDDSEWFPDIDPSGQWMAHSAGHDVQLVGVANPLRPPRVLGGHDRNVTSAVFHPDGRRVASSDRAGAVKIWSVDSSDLVRSFRAPGIFLRFDPAGASLASWRQSPFRGVVWTKDEPPQMLPVELGLRPTESGLSMGEFDSRGRWFAAPFGSGERVALFPLTGAYHRVIPGSATDLVFPPDGSWLAASSTRGVTVYPIRSGWEARALDLVTREQEGCGPPLAVDPTGRFLLVGAEHDGRPQLVPLDGGPPRQMPDFDEPLAFSVDFAPDGSRAAVGVWKSDEDARDIWIWNLADDTVFALAPVRGVVRSVRFTPNGGLLVQAGAAVSRFDLNRREVRVVVEAPAVLLDVAEDGKRLLVRSGDWWSDGRARIHDLERGSVAELPSHGNRVMCGAFGPSNQIVVTGGADGIVRAGPISGDEPHLLVGHRQKVEKVVVSPDGKHLVSTAKDGTIRFWPMPDLARPPLQTLSRSELVAELKSVTNLQVIADPEIDGGVRIELEPIRRWPTRPDAGYWMLDPPAKPAASG